MYGSHPLSSNLKCLILDSILINFSPKAIKKKMNN